MFVQIKKRLKEIEENAKGKVYSCRDIYMSEKLVYVATSFGGYKYKECQFVYVPYGDVKNATLVYPITGGRKGLSANLIAIEDTGVYNFAGLSINEKHCLAEGGMVTSKKISEDGLAFLAEQLNAKHKERAEKDAVKHLKKRNFNDADSYEI